MADLDTDAMRDAIARNTATGWQLREWVEDLLPELDRMRAELVTLQADYGRVCGELAHQAAKAVEARADADALARKLNAFKEADRG